MSNVNKAILVGNLGRDPELRSTAAGQPVATLSLATNRKWKDRNGTRHEDCQWHSVVCWGRLAEIAGQYLRKGGLVYVEGRLQTRSWEDRKSGETKYRTEVVCEKLQMLGGRDTTPQHEDVPSTTGGYNRGGEWEGEDDDIPF